ncbi:LacI family DNA-binding transcriptional regulator [Moorella naiadis]|uniref:LacI family DNA-binding transcriptional regulator n=1 Tax=Moorella naiadis (nom. illeg.) TaxID=3093670 RepID=UPI003D9C9898
MINGNDAFRSLPTIKDVAAAAGVSLKTVSRVINGDEHVREQTKAKVLAAIKAMGYQPNAIARSLRVKKTYTIGVIIADITNSFYSAIVRGIEDIATNKNYSLLIANSDEMLKKEKQYTRIFVEKQVEGMIIVPAGGSHQYLEHLAGHLPLVFVDRQPEDFKSASIVKVENSQGAYNLTCHLLQHGYREIAYIGHIAGLTTGEERFAGFQKAMEEHGQEITPSLVRMGSKTVMDAFRATQEVLTRQLHRPQAIFATNNIMVLGALRALTHLGLEVPRDIALVGFDDFETADTCRPRLTVVSQPAYAMGREAAMMLFRQMEGTAAVQEITLSTELIIRESCGCLGQFQRQPGQEKIS